MSNNNKEPLKDMYKRLGLYFIFFLGCTIIFKLLTYLLIVIF